MVDAPALVVARAKRQRRARTRDDAIFDLAVECWFEWLLAQYLPVRRVRLVGDAEIEDVYAGFVRGARSNVEHSDSTLDAILAEESRGHAWPSSIHRIVLGLPKTWQMLFLVLGGNYSQAEIARAIGVQQRNVCVMVGVLKMDFMPALRRVPSTEAEVVRRLGRAHGLRLP
jgi:hypothetical protein